MFAMIKRKIRSQPGTEPRVCVCVYYIYINKRKDHKQLHDSLTTISSYEYSPFP